MQRTGTRKQGLRSCPFCGRWYRLEREGTKRHMRICPAFKHNHTTH